MRITVLAGFFVVAVFVVSGNSSVSAEAQKATPANELQALPLRMNDIAVSELKVGKLFGAKQPEPKPKPIPQPLTHDVGPNETLTSIGVKYNTSWNRLFDKNQQIANPEVVVVGDKITVPLPDEQLAERPLPRPVVVAPPAKKSSQSVQASVTSTYAAASVGRGSDSSNAYSPGYCTWYAKNMRPDLPNNLGNANTWVSRAAAQGIGTGSAPQVGAIGQQGMHVVYVQSVNGDGTVTISEMNYRGLYVISSRTVPASTFQYVY